MSPIDALPHALLADHSKAELLLSISEHLATRLRTVSPTRADHAPPAPAGRAHSPAPDSPTEPAR
ncbi:hypothetical protein ACFQVC_32255 [Streptomyces monticola]|uniref:FXSXX-COOH protein n=1 Tax=Streptomyces monticola TaxID=2666263 RepID=A0ABW2JU66_9ACTN